MLLVAEEEGPPLLTAADIPHTEVSWPQSSCDRCFCKCKKDPQLCWDCHLITDHVFGIVKVNSKTWSDYLTNP